jgi:DNA-binding MarR family transcriptional regulator
MTRLARRLEALDLRPAQATVLMVIEAKPGITQSDIGKLLEIASANMATLAERLAERNLIDRQRMTVARRGCACPKLATG